MKVTVVFEDGVILVDNDAKQGFTFSGQDENWRVIQWYGQNGWIEVYRGDRIWLDSIDVVQPYIDMWFSKAGDVNG